MPIVRVEHRGNGGELTRGVQGRACEDGKPTAVIGILRVIISVETRTVEIRWCVDEDHGHRASACPVDEESDFLVPPADVEVLRGAERYELAREGAHHRVERHERHHGVAGASLRGREPGDGFTKSARARVWAVLGADVHDRMSRLDRAGALVSQLGLPARRGRAQCRPVGRTCEFRARIERRGTRNRERDCRCGIERNAAVQLRHVVTVR